ncbi:MAG TPA: hypothetical protein PKH31_03420 [Candidatus Sumerlaeota bacterium]|nr:hypothetical protein [Candidatus Sumerlaeota bacterium]
MARKKNLKGKGRPAWLPSGSVILWSVVVAQAIWLAGFIWSTGSPLPPAWTRWVSQVRQQRTDESDIQDLLLKRGSQGPAVTNTAP